MQGDFQIGKSMGICGVKNTSGASASPSLLLYYSIALCSLSQSLKLVHLAQTPLNKETWSSAECTCFGSQCHIQQQFKNTSDFIVFGVYTVRTLIHIKSPFLHMQTHTLAQRIRKGCFLKNLDSNGDD